VLSLAALEPPPDLDAITTTPHLHGDRTTFVFRGNADRVGIRHFMARFPRFPVFDRIDRDLHVLTVELPLGARVEYLLEVTERAAERTVLDPLNPRTATNPFGRNSVAFGPGYAEPWWIRPWSGPKGVLRRGHVESGAFGERRSLQWYHPPALRGRLPLVVVHDGRDFVEHAALVTVLDNLIGASVIPPVVAAIIDPDERLIEYGADDRQAAFIREVVDLAVRRHRVDPDPERTDPSAAWSPCRGRS
jgi:enterochelin esterase family protein